VYLLLRPDDGGVERISSERRPPCVRVPLPETPVGTIARVRVSLFHEMNKNLVYTRPIARPFLIRESTAGRDTVGYDYVKIFDTPGHRNPSRGYSRQQSPTNRREPEVLSGTGPQCRWRTRRDIDDAASTGATGGRGRHPPILVSFRRS
jgi:hypothetical protein